MTTVFPLARTSLYHGGHQDWGPGGRGHSCPCSCYSDRVHHQSKLEAVTCDQCQTSHQDPLLQGTALRSRVDHSCFQRRRGSSEYIHFFLPLAQCDRPPPPPPNVDHR